MSKHDEGTTAAKLVTLAVGDATGYATRFALAVDGIAGCYSGDVKAARTAFLSEVSTEVIGRLSAIDPDTFNPESVKLTGKFLPEAIAGMEGPDRDTAEALRIAFGSIRVMSYDAARTVERLTTKSGKVAKASRAEFDAIVSGKLGAVSRAKRAVKAPATGKAKPTTLVAGRAAVASEIARSRKRIEVIVAGLSNGKSRSKLAKEAEAMLAELVADHAILDTVEV